VTENSRKLRVRCLWFPTSDCLETWLIPSGTTRSRQYHESTMLWHSLPLYHLVKCLLLLCHVLFVWKIWQSTISGCTGASCVKPWLTCDSVQTASFWKGWARFRGDRRSGTIINSALLTPGYSLALLQELSQCPRALTSITMLEQVRRMNLACFLYQFKKRFENWSPPFESMITLISFSRVQVHP